jgi:hypothetical protein
MSGVETGDDRRGLGHGGERNPQCPYLQLAKETSRYPIEGYCRASSGDELRVVTIGEFNELCTTPDHIRCEHFRRMREGSAIDAA